MCGVKQIGSVRHAQRRGLPLRLRVLAGAALCLACFSPTARADLDPEADKPYLLKIVLHVADNRFLTPVFQEQLRQALRDRLQMTLGRLARVEVVRTHPLLAEVEAKGLEAGLDGWEELSSWKTAFVLVDFANGVYTLKTRQYDGMTGLLSPAVRQAHVNYRLQVAEAAARLVEQDVGLMGTVVATGKFVEIAFKGGRLGVKMDPWVKPGDVYAISRITKEGDKLRGRRVTWALLEVQDRPRDGKCRCRLWHRFQEDDLGARPGVLGYRCLRVATTPGPVKLRFLDGENFRPLDGLQVHVLAAGGGKAAEFTTNRDGLIVSRDSYQHMALIRVLSGDTVRAQFPVELCGDRTVVCPLKFQAEAEAQAPVEFRKDQWLRRILDNLRLAVEGVPQLNRELSQSMEGALRVARTRLKNMDSEISFLTLERNEIRRQAEERKAKIDLRDGELSLGALNKKKEDLEQFIARIEGALKDATSETTLGLRKMLERARLLEGAAEFDQAIALYEKVLKASPGQPKLVEHLAKLKEAWTPKNLKHAEARAFLVQTWPALEVADLKDNLAKARAALDVCRDANDRLTPLKVLQADVIHVSNLKKRLDALKRGDSDDNRTQAKMVEQVIRDLRRLHAEAKALAGKTKE